jgi:hypothetical protein
MYMEADLLDGVGDIGTGERQVLKGPGEAPKLSRISNRRTSLQSTMPARSRMSRANWC